MKEVRMQETETNQNFQSSSKNNLLLILQISDSVFPTGGFTHSMGCEAALQRYQIVDENSLKLFIISNLENYGSNSLPYVKTSHANCEDLKQLINLDYHYNITHSNHIANRSSKQQGRSFLHASSSSFNLPIFKEIEKLIDENQIDAFHEIVFGFVCGSLGIDLNDTLQIYLFGVLRTMVNSVVRLGKIIGPMKAQTIQFELEKIIPNIIERNIDRGIDTVCSKFPLPDLTQASHDTLFSRLFYS